MKRIRGTKSLLHTAVNATVDLVELGHESTARTVMKVLGKAGPIAEPVRQADEIRRVITKGVLLSVKGVNRAVEAVSDVAIDAFGPLYSEREKPVPLRSDLMLRADVVADAALGVVNGFVGDQLAGNGLDVGMRLRSLEEWITSDGRGVLPEPTGKIVVLVHGLAATEWSWCLDAERHLGRPDANFGTLLGDDLGFTPIYARYNTGRHISVNGKELSDWLDSLILHWPVPVAELVLVGHSMGGLVSRSACNLAMNENKRWVSLVSRVATLGSPMRGAPLEQFANAAGNLLSKVDLPATRISGEILQARSAGIKDLRYGYTQAREWEGRDPDAATENRLPLSLPPHIAWCFVAATVAAKESNPVSLAMGDLLVRVQSAHGPAGGREVSETHHVGGLHHAEIQVHPKVYEILREFLSAKLAAG